MNQSKRYFCFGLGYTGLRLARKLATEGWSVAGTTRFSEKYHQLKSEGIEAYFFRSDQVIEHPEAILKDTTHLLISIPPDKRGDAVYHSCKDAIEQLPDLKWVGYLSTTGVYGDHGGEWVDETTPTKATDDRVRARIEAEQQWLSLVEKAVPMHIFRLAGIYGPGNSLIERVQSGAARRIMKPGHMFSRIHVDDIITTLKASIERPMAGEIYNLCDDMPASPDQVVEYAAQLVGIEPPPAEAYADAPMSEMMRSFYSANRKVRNDKIKAQLGVELAYPTYKHGLDAIYKASLLD